MERQTKISFLAKRQFDQNYVQRMTLLRWESQVNGSMGLAGSTESNILPTLGNMLVATLNTNRGNKYQQQKRTSHAERGRSRFSLRRKSSYV